jgi:uncharacterized protein (TIGR03435 family)
MRIAILTLLLCGVMFAQGADPALSFEVASVRPSVPDANGRLNLSPPRGGPGTDDPERFSNAGVSLKGLVLMAYNVKSYQVTAPAWLDTERYDIVAKIPPAASKEQFNQMLQNLLTERFHLALHRETKELPAYELVIGKNGSKLKETTMDLSAPAPAGARGPIKMDPNGFPVLDRVGMMTMMTSRNNVVEARLVAKAQPVSMLLQMLEGQLKGPVLDKTGLTGKYDFTLEYSPDTTIVMPLLAEGPPGGAPGGTTGGTPPEITSGPPLGKALQEQLGLRLEQKKAPLELLVIDRADKTPTEN